MKKYIMQVEDCFIIPEKGMIISGTNEQFNRLSGDKIKEIIGNEIIVENKSREQNKYEVDSIDISNSLIGKKNICICLGNKLKIEDLEIKSSIWSV